MPTLVNAAAERTPTGPPVYRGQYLKVKLRTNVLSPYEAVSREDQAPSARGMRFTSLKTRRQSVISG